MGGTCPRAPTEAQRWCWTFAATRAHRASLSCPHSSASPRKKSKAGEQGNHSTLQPRSWRGQQGPNTAGRTSAQGSALLAAARGEQGGDNCRGVVLGSWATVHSVLMLSKGCSFMSNLLFMFIIASLECRVPETNPRVKQRCWRRIKNQKTPSVTHHTDVQSVTRSRTAPWHRFPISLLKSQPMSHLLLPLEGLFTITSFKKVFWHIIFLLPCDKSCCTNFSSLVLFIPSNICRTQSATLQSSLGASLSHFQPFHTQQASSSSPLYHLCSPCRLVSVTSPFTLLIFSHPLGGTYRPAASLPPLITNTGAVRAWSSWPYTSCRNAACASLSLPRLLLLGLWGELWLFLTFSEQRHYFWLRGR